MGNPDAYAADFHTLTYQGEVYDMGTKTGVKLTLLGPYLRAAGQDVDKVDWEGLLKESYANLIKHFGSTYAEALGRIFSVLFREPPYQDENAVQFLARVNAMFLIFERVRLAAVRANPMAGEADHPTCKEES